MTAGPMHIVRTVLVADDTAFVRDRFKAAIEDGGHHAFAVGSRSELVSLVRTGDIRFDLIVVDLHLSNGRGIETLRVLQSFRGIGPIVIFSGTIANVTDVRQLAELGVAGYINEYIAAQHILPALAPYLFPDHYRRRSSPRVALGIPVSYRFSNTIATATMVNISPGGLGIRTASVLEIATPIKVRFRLPGTGQNVDAEAVVAWVERRIGMGVQFTLVTGDGPAIIERFVQAHFFRNRRA
jgi:CheY-like chemotaxis protein